MKITLVRYGALVNLGNFENERVEVEAQLEEGDTVTETVEKLRSTVMDELGQGDRYKEMVGLRRSLQAEIRDLERKTEKARGDWDQIAEFLRTQGLRPDAPDAPLMNLITSGDPPKLASEKIEVSEHDIVDN